MVYGIDVILLTLRSSSRNETFFPSNYGSRVILFEFA